jgi:hypothetical protein
MAENLYRIHFRQGEFELDVEGDRGFVESYVAAFIAGAPVLATENEAAPIVKPGRKPGAKRAEKVAAPIAGLGRKSGVKRVEKASKRVARPAAPKAESKGPVDASALKDYLKDKQPESNKEFYLAFMGFLKARGQASVSNQMVQDCFIAAGAHIPPTGRQNFSILRNDGFVKPGSNRGMWTLTTEGEAKIESLGKKKAPSKTIQASKSVVKAKAAKKTAPKPATKKLSPKKPAAKKPDTKKPRAKKLANTKTAAKKTAAKKPARKVPVKVAPKKKAPPAKPHKPVQPKAPKIKIVKVIPEPEEQVVELVETEAAIE